MSMEFGDRPKNSPRIQGLSPNSPNLSPNSLKPFDLLKIGLQLPSNLCRSISQPNTMIIEFLELRGDFGCSRLPHP